MHKYASIMHMKPLKCNHAQPVGAKISSNRTMILRPGSFLIPAFLVAGCAFGQISYPGQYPPGQYPPGQYPGQGRYPQGGSSSPFPGRGRTSSKTQQDSQAKTPVITIVGMLRRMSGSDMVVEADDKRIVTLGLAGTTKYYKAAGGNAKTTDLQPGDHLTIDATRDDKGSYHGGAPASPWPPLAPWPLAGGLSSDACGKGEDIHTRRRRKSWACRDAGDTGGVDDAKAVNFGIVYVDQLFRAGREIWNFAQRSRGSQSLFRRYAGVRRFIDADNCENPGDGPRGRCSAAKGDSGHE